MFFPTYRCWISPMLAQTVKAVKLTTVWAELLSSFNLHSVWGNKRTMTPIKLIWL